MTRLDIRYTAAAPGAGSPVGKKTTDHLPLATFGFIGSPGAGAGLAPDDAIRLALTSLPDAAAPASEAWFGADPVARGSSRLARLATDGQLLFAAWTLDEADYGGIEAATAAIYQDMGRIVAESGYPHVVKIWNHFPAINQGEGDAERYRRFCVARAQWMPFDEVPPAATAIGFAVAVGEAPLTVFMLASKQAGHCIENPRQVPAFKYPTDYGPVSPSFSRGIWMPWGQLFVSGTASIVGHRSLHEGDIVAQVAELSRNLDALVGETQRRHDIQSLRPQALKIYLRRAADAGACARAITDTFPASTPKLTVIGDICRKELLVEVEGVWSRSEEPGDHD
jgi:chorismate lyase/3-hydroxybenzoate synthase